MKLAIALATAIGLPAAFAASTITAPGAALNTIGMGQTEMKGGTTKIGEIDPSAIPTAGPDAMGTLCNQYPSGVTISDLHIKIKKGTAESVEVGELDPVNFDGSGVAHVTYPAAGGLDGNECTTYTIDNLTADGSGDNLVLSVTPSLLVVVDETTVEVNSIAEYRFEQMSDLTRNGIAEMYHAGVLTVVTNFDPSHSMTQIQGSLSFPGTSSASLTGVHLFESDGDAITTGSVSISGNDFTLSGFPALEPLNTYRVVLLLDAPLGGQPMRAQLQGTFGT